MELLGVNSTKSVQHLHNENNKTLQQKVAIDIYGVYFKRLTIVKFTNLLKVIYRFDAIPIKFPASVL